MDAVDDQQAVPWLALPDIGQETARGFTGVCQVLPCQGGDGLGQLQQQGANGVDEAVAKVSRQALGKLRPWSGRRSQERRAGRCEEQGRASETAARTFPQPPSCPALGVL